MAISTNPINFLLQQAAKLILEVYDTDLISRCSVILDGEVFSSGSTRSNTCIGNVSNNTAEGMAMEIRLYAGKKFRQQPQYAAEPFLRMVLCELVALVDAISDRKKLTITKTYLETVLSSEPECVKVVSADGTLLDMNPAGLQMIEADGTYLFNQASVFDLIHPEDLHLFVSQHKKALKGVSTTARFRIKGLKGTERFMESTAAPLRDENGHTSSVVSITRDITPHLKQQHEVKNILQQSVDMICTINKEGRFVKVSAAAEQILGYHPDQMVGLHFSSFVQAEDHVFTQQAAVDVMAGHNLNGLENRYRRKDGGLVYLQWTARWDAEDQLFYCVARDVTEKKKADKIINLNQQRFRGLVQEGGDLVAILDNKGYYLYVSPTSEKILQTAPEEYIGKNAFDLIHPDDRQQVLEDFSRLRDEKRVQIAPFRFQHKNGTWRWVETVITNMSDDPSVGGIVANSRDVTEWISTQQALANLLEERDRILERITSAFIALDPAGNVVYWNTAAEKIMGVKREDLLGKNVWERFAWTKEMSFYKHFTEAMQHQQSVKFEEFFPVMDIWVEVYAYPSPEGISVFFQNITETKKADELIRIKNKHLETISSFNAALLNYQNWQSVLKDHMELIGHSANATGVCCYRVNPGSHNKDGFFNPLLKWHQARDDHDFSNKQLHNVPMTVFEPHRSGLENGLAFQTSIASLPETTFRNFLQSFGIQYMLCMPIRVEAGLWGLLCFYDHRPERCWSRQELEFLRTITSNLCSAIEAADKEQRLQEIYQDRINIIESITDNFYTMDREYRLTYINEAAQNFMQLDDSHLGKSVFSIFPDLLDTELYARLETCRLNRLPVQFEFFHPSSSKWYSESIYPRHNGFSVYFKDITPQKLAADKIKESNERFEKVAEATQDAIWDWDVTNDTRFWGGGFGRLLGRKKQVSNGRSWLDQVHMEDCNQVRESLEAALADPQTWEWQSEYRFLTGDDYAFVKDRGIIIRDSAGKAKRMVGAMSDITEIKAHEEALEKLNLMLEKRTLQLEAFNREIEAQNQKLKEIAWKQSHVVRAPVARILGLTNLMNETNLSPAEMKRCIDYIVKSSIELDNIIREIVFHTRDITLPGAAADTGKTSFTSEDSALT